MSPLDINYNVTEDDPINKYILSAVNELTLCLTAYSLPPINLSVSPVNGGEESFRLIRKRDTKRIAYADPPYIGLAHYYPENQEVDHKKLILELETYDAWALSCHSPSLKILLPMCPDDTRIAAWVKPFASFKPNVNPAYAWEPVLYKPLPRAREEQTIRDWVSASITMGKHMIGAKPTDFCFWLFELLGAREGDEFFDLYPGSKIVTKCWIGYQEKLRNKQDVLVFSKGGEG